MGAWVAAAGAGVCAGVSSASASMKARVAWGRGWARVPLHHVGGGQAVRRPSLPEGRGQARRGVGRATVDGAGSSKRGGQDGIGRRRERARTDPDRSPFFDGNRDRLYGLLTERAVNTLSFYLMELNMEAHFWLVAYWKANRIPKQGSWEEVNGNDFLRKMLKSEPEQIYHPLSGEPLLTVDPKNLAQRILAIRGHLAREWTRDLEEINEFGADLVREVALEALQSNFSALGLHASERMPEEEGDPRFILPSRDNKGKDAT